MKANHKIYISVALNVGTNMKVGLINIDSIRLPNLALMKLSSWHRNKGDDVYIIDLSSLGIDQWYGSKIFMGGSGYDIQSKLPKEIEAQVPDYEKFNTDFSIGFTSRGCVRDCGFCIVKEKEGDFVDCDFIKDIKHSKYIILDNNFLASSIWKEKLLYFIENKIKVNFNQGLDIRLIDDEKAELLSKVLYYDRTFKRKCIYFAFDNVNMENIFKEKLEIVLKYIKPSHIMIYMLVGYNSTFEEDIYRFNLIRSYKCDPFVMLYHKNDKKLKDFARYVNKRIYKKCDFDEYRKQY